MKGKPRTSHRALAMLLALTIQASSFSGIVAETIYMEARGESRGGRYAVASVIWNRAHTKWVPLKTVCLARKQFSCWNGGYKPPVPRNAREAAILSDLEAIEESMIQGTFRPSGDWTHYYNPSLCSPSWGRTMTHRKIIGNHLFGKAD